ncbi:hypothetical protein SRB5_57020 [Streptomyces sp. RB5]|uniref:DUF397 domain-containing protein n=1 Tax=Streptomyces smaragdinus TaxID=2585196 RepID=A0A7K0CPV2_9ACTN|nr:DUF397 domain-containing protein [Streptomyces smaragdinus]MQY15520.1 hypothetical protein [Streptomyces smaragdinus]
MSHDQLTWFKSSYSGGEGGECVEVAFDGADRVRVRDSKAEGRGSELVFTDDSWTAFVTSLRSTTGG